MEKMFSINEISQELGVAKRTIRHWITTKQLRAFRVGKRLTRVWESDLVAFIQGNAKSKGRRAS